jgi:hypothetical protein
MEPSELRQAEERGRQAGLREAITWCRSQVYDEEASSGDEYRRGQRRGALDCCSVLERLADYVPPRQGVGQEWSGWSAIRYLGILSADAGAEQHRLHLLVVGLEKGRWHWNINGAGVEIASGDCETLLEAQEACLQESLRLRSAAKG